jgi:hypothetical protein
MFRIELLTQQFRPDLLVTIRASQDWQRDVPGIYQDDRWTFTLAEQDHPGGLEFKFVLDRTAWMLDDNLQVPADPGGVYPSTTTRCGLRPTKS